MRRYFCSHQRNEKGDDIQVSDSRKQGKRYLFWESYRKQIRRATESSGIRDRVIAKIEYVPDKETELYVKAADVLILLYTHVFKSGVLFWDIALACLQLLRASAA